MFWLLFISNNDLTMIYLTFKKAFYFKYYGMGQDANSVLMEAQGRVCEYMNIVLRGENGTSGSDSAMKGSRSRQLSCNFVKRILKCKLTEMRTHDFLPHLVKRRKQQTFNLNGNRIRLGKVIPYDPEWHLNKEKKRNADGLKMHSNIESAPKNLENECCTKCKDTFQKLFKTENDDEKIEVTRKELMKFIDENFDRRKRVRVEVLEDHNIGHIESNVGTPLDAKFDKENIPVEGVNNGGDGGSDYIPGSII